jgi:hypothetical protein
VATPKADSSTPRARGLLQHLDVSGERDIGVDERRHAAHARHRFNQQFLALAVELG